MHVHVYAFASIGAEAHTDAS